MTLYNTIMLSYSYKLVNRIFKSFLFQASPNPSPQRISANVGDNVILKCAFEFPDKHKLQTPYVIHWLKNGQKLPIYMFYDGYPPHLGDGYEGRVSLLNQGEASLNLSNVRESDQGWYECKVFFLVQQNDQDDKNGTWVLLEVNCKLFFIYIFFVISKYTIFAIIYIDIYIYQLLSNGSAK